MNEGNYILYIKQTQQLANNVQFHLVTTYPSWHVSNVTTWSTWFFHLDSVRSDSSKTSSLNIMVKVYLSTNISTMLENKHPEKSIPMCSLWKRHHTQRSTNCDSPPLLLQRPCELILFPNSWWKTTKISSSTRISVVHRCSNPLVSCATSYDFLESEWWIITSNNSRSRWPQLSTCRSWYSWQCANWSLVAWYRLRSRQQRISRRINANSSKRTWAVAGRSRLKANPGSSQ